MSFLGKVTQNAVGVINYIANGKASDSTLGWATYADAAAAQPVDGTGGSPNVTFSKSTTTPLRQGADFRFVKDAVNRQGQGASYSFSIDRADQGKVLTVAFDYQLVSGTYATGDLTVYLIQDPTGTPVVLQPAGYQIQSATVGTKVRQVATFQTASNVTSYRLCLHVASSSASAYTIALDNVIVGPQVVQYGAPVTDWQSYTPTGAWTANTTYLGKYRRVGDSVEIQASVVLTGAPNAATFSLGLPTGLSIDTSKIADPTAPAGARTAIGVVSILDASISIRTGVAVYDGTTIRAYSADSAADFVINATNPIAFGAGDVVSVNCKLPILGWSSTVQMSNDTDTRVVAAKYGTSVAGTMGTAAPFRCDTKVFDTHGAVTTGAAWKYTAQVPGFYKITALIAVSTAGDYLYIYKNGVNTSQTIGACTNATALSQSGIIELLAGDYVDIRTSTNQTVVAKTESFISVERLSGPSAIAASETIAAKAFSQNVAVTANNPINFSTVEFDSHGSITTGSSWKFTANISGTYSVSAYVRSSVAVNGTVYLYKNGVQNGCISRSTDYLAYGLSGTILIKLIAGDYIDIRPDANMTTINAANQTNVSICRVGN